MPASENSLPNTLLDALLNSWDRNNIILIHLLRAVPQGRFSVRAAEGSPTIAQMFNHMHFVRLVFLEEDAPEFARALPETEWSEDCNVEALTQGLMESAAAVREAVKAKIESGGDMDLHYDHPVLFMQHMLWHEGYHHGQIKLALKVAGAPLSDEIAGPLTWDVWMDKTAR